jgi:hypothetical protein
MYCPKCSHEAVSNNVRFCPGCGFRMDGVAELVANNGVLAEDEETPPKPRRSMVKRGALLGATSMFIITLWLSKDLSRRADEAMIIYSCFWGALMGIIGVSSYLKRLISKIFSEEEPIPSKKIASPCAPALSAAQNSLITNSGQQLVDTTKMGHPSSVTEQTTSRLNKV